MSHARWTSLAPEVAVDILWNIESQPTSINGNKWITYFNSLKKRDETNFTSMSKICKISFQVLFLRLLKNFNTIAPFLLHLMKYKKSHGKIFILMKEEKIIFFWFFKTPMLSGFEIINEPILVKNCYLRPEFDVGVIL